MSRHCTKQHRRPTPAERPSAEQRARASIAARYGRALTEAEWEEIKANLRQLFGVLASWQLPPHCLDRKKRE